MKLVAKDRIAQRWIPHGYTLYRQEGDSVVYANLSTLQGKPAAIGYRGKSGKPAFNYIYRNEDQLKQSVDGFFDNISAHEKSMKEHRQKKKEFVTSLKVGDILVTHWGYDQTNRDFYQILSVKKNDVTLQEIQQHVTEDGFMCGKTVPVPNKPATEPKWVGNEMVGRVDVPILHKRVQMGEYVTIDEVRTAFKWDGTPKYVSWYA